MADFHPNPDGEFYTAIPLEVEDCAAIVKVVEGMVTLVVIGSAITATATLTRSEARGVALAALDASQHIEED